MKKQPIKYIYAIKFDGDSLKFEVKRLNVAKECAKYVSLENGVRIKSDNIIGLYVSGPHMQPWYRIETELINNPNITIYSIKPLNKELRKNIKESYFGSLEYKLTNSERYLYRLNKDISTYLESIESTKKLIEKEEKEISKLKSKIEDLRKKI